MSVSQEERLAILRDVSRTWLDLTRALRGLSDDEMEQPGVVDGWSVKILMGHITAWERKLIDEIRKVEQGQEYEFEYPTVDAFNEARARQDADRDLDDIRADFEETHEELMNLLEVTPVLSRKLVKDDTYEHYPDHTAHINAWRKRTGKSR